MQFDFNQAQFRDPRIAKGVLAKILSLVQSIKSSTNKAIGNKETPIRLMEVCGTHTVNIFRSGLRSIFDNIEGFELVSGPGCPVCVTPTSDIDAAIEIASNPNVILATFGDMVKVPGSKTSLAELRSMGANLIVIYSPIELINLAQNNADKQVVFFSVGFETTTPGIAYTIKKAKALGIKNLSVISVNKTVPPALDALCSMKNIQINGFILPGHVSAIIGKNAYGSIVNRYRIPAVITGFEPLEILYGVLMILEQIANSQCGIESAYRHAILDAGNTNALTIMYQVFEPAVAEWRGLGSIPYSGLRLNLQYEQFDAMKRFNIEKKQTEANLACLCGEVLIGSVKPTSCSLFGVHCNTENPIGACMVSGEGTCAAFYRYGGYES